MARYSATSLCSICTLVCVQMLLFIIYEFVVNIMLLNIMIAIMTSSFNKVSRVNEHFYCSTLAVGRCQDLYGYPGYPFRAYSCLPCYGVGAISDFNCPVFDILYCVVYARRVGYLLPYVCVYLRTCLPASLFFAFLLGVFLAG